MSIFRLGGFASNPPPTRPAAAEPLELSGDTMGTTYSVKIADPLQHSQHPAIARAVAAALDGVDRSMSTYRPDSELSHFNQRADANQPFPISPALRQVLEVALAVGERSHGALDITVGALIDAWGFGPAHPAHKPDAATLAALREQTGLAKLKLDAAGLTRTTTALRCDLSAIAKGHAVDEVAKALDHLGINNYLVEVGGELRARGQRSPEQPFRVGIEEPDPHARAIARIIPLTDRAMATSGDYRNFFIEGNRRRSHLLDPRTGAPVAHDLVSVSVLHASAAWADAWATALLVLGPEAGPSLAEELDLPVLFIVHPAGQQPRSISSTAFAASFGRDEDPS